jgi:hypothetical protein
VVVYFHIEAEERVAIVSVEDGRTASATISRERDPSPPA